LVPNGFGEGTVEGKMYECFQRAIAKHTMFVAGPSPFLQIVCRQDLFFDQNPHEDLAFIFCVRFPDQIGVEGAVGTLELYSVC